MSRLHGKVGEFYASASNIVTRATSVAMTTMVGSNMVYTVSEASKRYWDNNYGATVYVGGVATTVYTKEYIGGEITFSTVPGATVTTDFHYQKVESIGGGFSWSFSSEDGVVEAPVFQNEWMSKVPGIKDWNITFERWFANDGMASMYERGANVFVIGYMNLSSGGGTIRIEGRGKLETTDISAPSEELIDQSLTFQGNSTPFFREGYR